MKKYLLKSIVAFIFLLIAGKAHAQRPNNYNDITSTSIVGNPVTITFTHTGAAATSYTITPALPSTLTLNNVPGNITGTPTVVSGPTTYTVTPRNGSGNGNTFTVRITVNPQAPNITYTTPHSYPTGTAITPLNPNNTGGAATYSVAPALPAGLILNTTTGIISGAPTAVVAARNYVVTATNVTGSDTFTINIGTTLGLPDFTYNTPNTFTAGTVATLNPTSSGGTIATYSAASLPAGMTITPTGANAGRISGTPTTPSPATDYVITATNATGSSTFTINITVNVAAPNVTYPTSKTFTAGTPIAPFGPTSNTGGAVATYSATLPAGLSIDAATGIISGTPTTAAGATNYTVKATNATNFDNSTISITINPAAPAISYTSPVTLVVGTAATLNVSSTGGAVANYTDVTGLPDGLTLQNNGNITGTPTTVSAAQNYTIRATNVTGNINTIINITVNPAKPNISYTTPVTVHVGTTVALAPTNTGGAADSYTFALTNPSLPAGLTFSTVTGVISGTPTTVVGQQSYNITATNITGTSATTIIKITVTAASSNIYDWTGAASDTKWENPLNWEVNDVQQTANYPGSAFTADVARIGVNTDIQPFNSFPVLSTANITIASLTFGNNNVPLNNNTGGIQSLTVNGFTLTVTNTITQTHSSTGGSGFFTNSPGVTTTLLGNGAIICGNLTVGDLTTLPVNDINSITQFNIGKTTAASTLSVTVNGDFTINSASNSGLIVKNSYGQVSLAAGTLTINGTLRLVNGSPSSFYFLTQFAPKVSFSIDLNNFNSPVLNLAGALPLNIGNNNAGNAKNSLDFFNPPAGAHNHGTVNYTGINQRVYNVAATGMNSFIDGDGATNGDGLGVYDNLGFSGTGTKTLDAGTFKVAGNFSLLTTGTVVTLATNNPTLTVAGDYSTAAGSTFTNGTNPLTIGGSFANGGASNFGNPLVTFNSTGPATLTTVAPFTFTNVALSNNGLKTLTSGDFSLANTGILTMIGTSTILDVSPTSTLTLNSDANASASVAIIPTGCKITGLVKVQRYVSAKRAYRLISSPVNSGTTTPTSVYSLNYVQNSMYLTGTNPAGGFDKVTAGPTLYLYKESFAGTNQAFTAGNFRDITDITTGTGTAPVYSVDLETNPLSLPVGGAFLAFYRGNKADGTVDQETVTTFVPTAATMTATGVLNQGTVTFKDVFTGLSTLSFANALPAALGFNPIGNPYASSIDLETLGAGGIVAPGVSNFIYELNPVNQVYEIYPVGNAALATGNATRYIASGQGFFMMATATGQTVTINESAKVNAAATQNTGPKLFMSAPANIAVAAAPQYFRLRMMKDSINTVDAVVGFKSTAKGKFDSFEDAPFRSGPASMSFASITDDNRQSTINQLPLAQKGQSIRFNVGGVVNTPYTINVSALEGIPAEYDVWLKDAYKKDSLDMRVNKSYSFTLIAADTGSYGAYRFSVVLRQNPARAYKLISFTGSKTPKKDVELDWTTQNEENYTHFTVERSTNNGRTYNVVDGVNSNGTGNYSLVDKNPSKNNLYRLKQVDINDSVSYSNIVKIDFSNRGDDMAKCINVYPNPGRDRITLSIDAKAPLYKIQITNGWGFILQQATSRDPHWQTNVGRFLPGTYYIQVRNERDWSLIGQTKFVKL